MVGSTLPCKVDVRILASTNKDLAGLVKKGTFREDLFFRLNVITIELPPLRERENDALLLARRFAGELRKAQPVLSDAALKVLREYHWPGNVRELEYLVQHLIVMTDGNRINGQGSSAFSSHQ